MVKEKAENHKRNNKENERQKKYVYSNNLKNFVQEVKTDIYHMLRQKEKRKKTLKELKIKFSF